MKRSILVVGAALMLAATTMGQQNVDPNSYSFPSPWNPGGKASKDIKQWIAITWDDNQYSGAGGSYYESEPGQKYANVGRVDGIAPKANPTDTWTNKQNQLNIYSTGSGKDKIGLAWAFENLGNEKSVPMTFNMITGLFVNTFVDKQVLWSATPTEAVSWQRGQSKLGFWTGQELGTDPIVGNDAEYWPMVPDDKGYWTVAIAWGREMRTGINPSATEYAQQNFVTEMVNKIISSGKHEIGNHTIDHMETNSLLSNGKDPVLYPAGLSVSGARAGKRGFAYITSGSDNDVSELTNRGFSNSVPGKPGVEMMPWGIEIDQSVEYGTKGHALIRGWATNVGRWMERDVWKRYIEISEEWLTNNYGDKDGGLGYSKAKITGFRAPRLEVNSNMHYALKDLGYYYDCGLEEGYESHVDGYNFLWPYTTDNGIRNSWTKVNVGERVFVDTMPTSLWQFPVNCLIVPENIRADVVKNWNEINSGLGAAAAAPHTPANEWDGKVTGFDFNAWVLYGMTKANFLATMKHTLDRRMTGNKAPFQYGAHTDYYTPIYDNGTLQNAFNKNNYGLSVTKGWNNWKIRQEGTEEFVDYAKGKGAIFLTARALLDSVAAMSKDNWNRATSSKNLGNDLFVLHSNGNPLVEDLSEYQNRELSAPADLENPANRPSFVYMFNAGEMTGMTHIELSYKSRTATAIRLIMTGGKPTREVVLAHRYSPVGTKDGFPSDSYESGALRNTGRIPLTSFDFELGYTGIRNYSSINPADIIGIEIVPLAPDAKFVPHGKVTDTQWWDVDKYRTEPFALKFQIEDIKIWTGNGWSWEEENLPTKISKVNTAGKSIGLALAGMSSNALKLNISQAGLYNIKIFSANGRMLQSFDAASLTAGVNSLRLNNLAAGVYMIKVQGINTKQLLTKSALVF